MSQCKFKPHDLSDEKAKLGRKQCRDLSEAKTQVTSKMHNVML